MGIHRFVAKDITNEYEEHFMEFIGFNTKEECVLCGKKVSRFYFHGNRTYAKSRTCRNTVRADKALAVET